MSYGFVADRIEIRNLRGEGREPKYVVKGTAMVANKKDIYQYSKKADGTFKTLHSIFTPGCIQSIKEQAKHKKLFVDSQHELALNTNIKTMLKGKLSPEEEGRIDAMLKTKMLPLAKISSIDIKDDSLDIETELNPVFREVDADHQKYFDAIWYSLEHKYLNGISVNFANPQVIYEEGEPKIDNVDVLGFSYVDAPALADNSIYEVAIRAMQEGIDIRIGEKMEDEKNRIEAEKLKLEEERNKLQKEREDITRQKLEMDKKIEIDKQAVEQKKIQQELESKAEALKKIEEENAKLKGELNNAKGLAAQEKKPVHTGEFYKEKLKEITKEHDETMDVYKRGQKPMIDKSMKGFAELVNLQAKAGNYTADLDNPNAAYIRDNRLLERSKSDVVLGK